MAEGPVVVVGAGIAGLASALHLAARGVPVTVLERAPAPGGKLRQVPVGGAPVDCGPTVFTMRWVFDGLLADAGLALDDRLHLEPLSVLARHAWSDRERLDLFADQARSAEAIGAFAGAAEARRFQAFCREARRVYRALEGPYIRASRPSLAAMGRDLSLDGLAALAALGPFRSLWKSLARHFRDPRLQQLFGRYATYCGSSPWLAPATLVLVAQVEMDGVWAVRGGMHAVARMLAEAAAERGAQFRYGAHCEGIVVRGGRAVGVRLGGGEELAASEVIFNGDVAALRAGMLGDELRGAVPAARRAQRSLSALTWAILGRTGGFPLLRHNVFFQPDYAAEFRDIFGAGRLPAKGTVYVCAQDRTDAAEAPEQERLLCLVNAPAGGDRGTPNEQEMDRCERECLALLNRCGLTIEASPQNRIRTGPQDFERLFPGTGGALYGQATHGWMSAFARPGSSSRIPGLFLAGGSVHPGPGVPMAAMSGRLAAATLLAHRDSTSRWRRVVISGGTSMR
jgi:1-hydroxycarotenoid 3,4-desaturase